MTGVDCNQDLGGVWYPIQEGYSKILILLKNKEF